MDAETAREIGRLETTVASLVKAVEALTKTVNDLRDQSIADKSEAKSRQRRLLVMSNIATAVVSIGSQFGAQLSALLPFMPHAPR